MCYVLISIAFIAGDMSIVSCALGLLCSQHQRVLCPQECGVVNTGGGAVHCFPLLLPAMWLY